MRITKIACSQKKKKTQQLRKINVFRSHLYDIYTKEVNKIALSSQDDKRVVQEGGIHILAVGQYKPHKINV